MTGSTPTLKLTLRGPDDEPVEGRLVQTHFESRRAVLYVEFPPERTPELAIGQVAQLFVSGEGLGRELSFPGRSTFRARGERSLIRFQVGVEEGMAIDVAVDRRSELRVRPDGSELDVVVTDSETGVACRPAVCDVSATGVGLLFSLHDESRLAATWRVRVALTLPGHPEPVERVGDVRYRKLEGSSIRVGIEFDRSLHDGTSTGAIEAFVTERRAALLEAVAARSSSR